MRSLLPVCSFLMLMALFSCNADSGSSPEAATVATDTFDFKPNPQEMPAREVPVMALGSELPDFKLPGADGRYYQRSDFQDAKATLIIFTCNHCPTAQAYEERIKDIAEEYGPKGVATIGVSPNSPVGLLYEELGYTDLNDDYEAMVIRARDHQFNFPYLYDGDDHAFSMKLGPVATPHVFLFDADKKLVYQGRLDSLEKPGAAHAEDIRLAMDELLAGKPLSRPETKTFGCSTKWAWKTEYRTQVQEKWNKQAVALQQADVNKVKALIKNEDSKKLRLINVWATWCGPCIIEYPEFIAMQRMYGARDFEFVSLSADKPEQEAKALQFLQKEHSGVANYIFTGKDNYALIEAVDPNWNGALPYTILVEPGGKVVYAHQGSVAPLDVKRAIVEHPMIGRYY